MDLLNWLWQFLPLRQSLEGFAFDLGLKWMDSQVVIPPLLAAEACLQPSAFTTPYHAHWLFLNSLSSCPHVLIYRRRMMMTSGGGAKYKGSMDCFTQVQTEICCFCSNLQILYVVNFFRCWRTRASCRWWRVPAPTFSAAWRARACWPASTSSSRCTSPSERGSRVLCFNHKILCILNVVRDSR